MNKIHVGNPFGRGEHMKEFPKGGIIGKLVHAAKGVQELRIPLHAANAGYFIVLSVFPALLLILSLMRYTGLQVETLMDFLTSFLPEALVGTAEELVYSTYQNSTGALVGLSAVTTLWSASRGIYGLLTGLNAVYGVAESRGWFRTRLISVVYTFVFFLVLLLTLALHVFGSTLIGMLTMIDNAVLIFLVDLLDLRFFLLLILQTLIFTLMFMALPNRRNRFRDSLSGGLFASLGWLVFSDAYSFYVENFQNYSNIYGSVYAIALAMLWLYCCMAILFAGGVLNRYLMER